MVKMEFITRIWRRIKLVIFGEEFKNLNMEKQKLLHILEDDRISINTKLALVDKYFDNSNSIVSTTNNMFGGGLLKDTDFFNL